MKRRGFLRLLGRGTGVAAGAAIAPSATAKILTESAWTRHQRRCAGIVDGNFAKVLYPGLKKWYQEAWDDYTAGRPAKSAWDY